MTSIELKLEKGTYNIGDRIKGVFRLTHGDGWLDFRPIEAKLYLEVTGEEITTVLEEVPREEIDPNTGKSVPVTDPETGQPIIDYLPRTESNIFFKKSLSSQIRKLGRPSSDGYVIIEKGVKEAPFEFILSEDKQLFQSYQSDTIRISYQLTGLVDKKNRPNTEQKVSLNVRKSPIVKGDQKEIEKNAEVQSLSLSIKTRKDMYARGESILGEIALRNPTKKNIAAVNVGIQSVERALAHNLSFKVDRLNYTQSVPGKWNDGDIRTFEINIPSDTVPSFQAMNSEYYWELVAAADASSNLAEDIFITSRITIE